SVFRLLKHQRAGIKHVWKNAGIILRIWRVFCAGAVAGRRDEFSKRGICHRRPVHKETVDGDTVCRSFFWVVPVGPHKKSPALDENHIRTLSFASGDASRTPPHVFPFLIPSAIERLSRFAKILG